MSQACCWGVWANSAPARAMSTKSTTYLGLAPRQISRFIFRAAISGFVAGVITLYLASRLDKVSASNDTMEEATGLPNMFLAYVTESRSRLQPTASGRCQPAKHGVRMPTGLMRIFY